MRFLVLVYLIGASALMSSAPKVGDASTAGATVQATAKPASQANISNNEAFRREDYFGNPVRGKDGGLIHVAENQVQLVGRAEQNYIMVRVKNIRQRTSLSDPGRIRIALWDSPQFHAVEGKRPFRASSHLSRDAVNGEMLFHIGGIKIGQRLSIFVHDDRNNLGRVKKFLGIPLDPYMFSNAIKRQGFSVPSYDSTAVLITKNAQEIVIEL